MATVDVKIPDIGDFKDVPVIEVFVKVGDVLKAEDPILTLESDKATLEVPSPSAGKVAEILIKVGDKVSMGSAVLRLEAAGSDTASAGGAKAGAPAAAPDPVKAAAPAAVQGDAPRRTLPPPLGLDFGNAHASPSVRRLARELDVDLTAIKGTGDKGRVTLGDVKTALKGSGGGGGGVSSGTGIPEIPAQDFAKFGEIEVKPLSRLKKLSGAHLSRAWLNVPLVTHTDEADITDIEAYRKMLDGAAKEKGYRVTLLAFLLKASVSALKAYPEFNSSLSPDKGSLIYKKYYNIGVAVDTPDGLVVPVIKDVDRKGITELCQELGSVSKRMRDGKIAPADISGGTFSISSLGGIGGTNFTPLVSAPEVGILGVPRATMKPVWDGHAFQPRLMLPLCVSYDHRVVDGALGARFTRHLAAMLEDVRQLVL
ncbi:MAG: 2-oxo acid dehydrogenase subunit E2 [Hyphomicrobiaceae bacterium]